jgi:RadC-like JAB domain
MAGVQSFPTRVKPDGYIDSLIEIVGSIDAEIVVLTCVDGEGWAGENEVLAKPGGDKTEIPMDLLFGFALNRSAPSMMVASKSSGSIDCMHERDIRFTEELIAHGADVGVPLFEHVLIEGPRFRLMSQTMSWARERSR